MITTALNVVHRAKPEFVAIIKRPDWSNVIGEAGDYIYRYKSTPSVIALTSENLH